MAELEDKLGAVLNNPQLMQQIMTMAQSLGQQNTPPPQQPPPPEQSIPFLDPASFQKIVGIASAAGGDEQQKALLCALTPYLSRDRLARLEKAMQAAGLAKAASALLGSGVLQAIAGR